MEDFREALFALADGLLGLFTRGDVASDAVEVTVRRRFGGPGEPSVRAVLALIPVDEIDGGGPGGQFFDFGEGLRLVVGMDELDEWATEEFIVGVAEGFLPGRVEPSEITICARNAKQVNR